MKDDNPSEGWLQMALTQWVPSIQQNHQTTKMQNPASEIFSATSTMLDKKCLMIKQTSSVLNFLMTNQMTKRTKATETALVPG